MHSCGSLFSAILWYILLPLHPAIHEVSLIAIHRKNCCRRLFYVMYTAIELTAGILSRKTEVLKVVFIKNLTF